MEPSPTDSERPQVRLECPRAPFERVQVPFERVQVSFERRRMVIWRSQTGVRPARTGVRPARMGVKPARMGDPTGKSTITVRKPATAQATARRGGCRPSTHKNASPEPAERNAEPNVKSNPREVD
jgi:hypothetical protein